MDHHESVAPTNPPEQAVITVSPLIHRINRDKNRTRTSRPNREWETFARPPESQPFRFPPRPADAALPSPNDPSPEGLWPAGRSPGFAQAGEEIFYRALEEIVLARNRIQHPESITSQTTRYSPKDIEKFPRAFFVDDRERVFFSDIEETERRWLIPPNVHITKDKLIAAITEVETFSDWLEAEISMRAYSR